MVFFEPEFNDKFIGKSKYFEPDFIKTQIIERKGLSRDLYERALNGLEYLAQLRSMGLDPIFKGGSAVQLLIPDNLQRLSIDIDLITDKSETELTSVLRKIKEKFNKKIYSFERVGLDLPSHLILYNLDIPSLFSDKSSIIQLDFLLHNPNYKIQRTPLKTFLYESKYDVWTPTIDALIGDKLTVLGPNTIGKPMTENPLNFAKQIYDISALLEFSKNFEEIYDAYFKIFKFEKKSRDLKKMSFNDAVDDLIYVCKLFTLVQHIPVSLTNPNIKAGVNFLKNGLSGLSSYTSSQLRLSNLRVRIISSKIAFLGKLLKLRHSGQITKSISMDSFKENNPIITGKVQDEKFVDNIEQKLDSEENFHIQFKEIKKTNPISLIYWYGYYFPDEFLS